MDATQWIKVVFSDECLCSCGDECCHGECGDVLICAGCGGDYAECECVGPTQDGYEYEIINGELYAKRML